MHHRKTLPAAPAGGGWPLALVGPALGQGNGGKKRKDGRC